MRNQHRGKGDTGRDSGTYDPVRRMSKKPEINKAISPTHELAVLYRIFPLPMK